MIEEQTQIRNIQGNTLQKFRQRSIMHFDNIGNDLSFALTLLDGNNNGFAFPVSMAEMTLVFSVNQ